MGNLTLLRPLRKLRLLCCQFCLILAERNHGRPNSRGYAPGDSSDRTTAEISNRWPPMKTYSFRNNPRGLTERVSAMRSPNGQFSQDVMPRVLHVALLMTFTPDPPSITHPWILVPCTRTLITGLRWSMIVGPRLVFVNKAGIALCGAYNRASIACRNRGTKFKSLFIVSVMG